jgi:hypothetical protein
MSKIEPFYRIIKPGQVLVDRRPLCMNIEAAARRYPLTQAVVAVAYRASSLLHELSDLALAVRTRRD